jgi:hypothetical protein
MNPFKRDQALNDLTSGQFGEEPVDIPENHSEIQKQEDERKKLTENFQKISNNYPDSMRFTLALIFHLPLFHPVHVLTQQSSKS